MDYWFDLEQKTGLTFREKNGSLLIKQRFLPSRFNIGGLLFFAIGAFFILIAFSRTRTTYDFYFMLNFGVILIMLSILITIKTLTDFLLITDTEIIFRNSLKKRTITIEKGLKVKVKAKKVKRWSRKTIDRTFGVDIYIKKDDYKYRIIDFLSELKDRESAELAGKMIDRYITKRIEALS